MWTCTEKAFEFSLWWTVWNISIVDIEYWVEYTQRFTPGVDCINDRLGFELWLSSLIPLCCFS